MRLAGIILDIYDDPKATVLLEKLAGRPLPEKLASSRLLSATELAELPDRLFAVVATNGEHVVRKYAMHDEPHLVTSMLYFLEKGHVLPEDVQKTAAARLVEACSWYDVTPPDALEKVAFLSTALNVASGVMGAKGLADTARQGMQTVRQNFRTGTFTKLNSLELDSPNNKGQSNLTASEEKSVQRGGPLRVPVDAEAKAVVRTSPEQERAAQQARRTPGAVDRVLSQLGAGEKTADLCGTDAMPHGALKVPTGGKNLLRVATKTASMTLDGHEAPVIEVRQTYEVFAMPHEGRYPLDTPELVKKAERYFDEHVQSMTPFERRVFAQSVWDRSHELGTKVAGAVLRYAGEGYGPNIDAELQARVDRLAGTGHETIYETLLEKRAEISPMIMASVLSDADLLSGISETYGRPATGCRDPFAAVYGTKTAFEEKEVADASYTWKDGTEYVTGLQLQNFAKRGPNQFDAHFGESFGKDFVKDPVGIFKSMPDPQKKMITRLMNSPSVAGAGDV